jgi:hypothetical protein
MLNPSIMPSRGTLFPTNVIPRFKQPRPSVERVVEAALQYYRRLDKELRQMGLKPADRRLFIQTLRLRPDVTQEEVIAATKQINVPTTHEEDGEGAAPAPANGALDMVAELELMREIALAEQRRAAELELALADAQSGDSALRGAANDSRQSSEDARLLLRRAEAAHERERKAWASRTEEAVAQLADLRRMQEQEAWRKKKEDHVNQSKVQKADRLVDSMDKAVFRADSRKLQIASHYRKLESELSQQTENNVVARRDFKAAIAHASKVNDEQGAHVMRLQAANIELVRRMRVATDTLKRNSKFAKQCDDAAALVDRIKAEMKEQWGGKLEAAERAISQLQEDYAKGQLEFKQKVKQVESEQAKNRREKQVSASLTVRLGELQAALTAAEAGLTDANHAAALEAAMGSPALGTPPGTGRRASAAHNRGCEAPFFRSITRTVLNYVACAASARTVSVCAPASAH